MASISIKTTFMKNYIYIFLLCAGFYNPIHTQTLPDDIDISNSSNGIVSLPSTVDPTWASNGFVKYTKIEAPNGQAIHFVAQDQLTDAQIVRARNILKFYLTDFSGSQYGANKSIVANQMAENDATLLLINGSDGQGSSPSLSGQPLYENEIAVEGHNWYINNDYEHRDAAFEEILHMMHDTGFGVDGPNSNPGALPAYQAKIRAAQQNAIANNFSVWPIGAGGSNPDTQNWYNELDNENSLSQEYLASVVDSYYGLWGAWTEEPGGMWGLYIAKTRAEVESNDPMGAALMPQYFSPHLNINMDIDPSFNGIFTMAFDKDQPYTHKAQYLQHCTLTGTNSSGLKGNDLYNRLTGNQSNNILEGGKGNDRIDGKGGLDIAKFTGDLADYTISNMNGMIVITDNSEKRDGIDTLLQIETLRFADQDWSTTTTTTSISTISIDQQLKVFPNPATTFLQAEWDIELTRGANINLFDGTGKMVRFGSIPHGDYQYRLDIAELPSGIYWLELTDGIHQAKKKIVVKPKDRF